MTGGNAADHGSTVSIADAGPMIVATVTLPDCTPAAALAAFTDPGVLARWWRGELAVDLATGGRYTVAFPAMGATLTGTVLSYDPAGGLEFSWSWDGQAPDSTVVVRASAGPGDGSTRMIIEHGPHADDAAGRTAHQEHSDGWEFFLPRLPAAVAAS